MHYIRIKIESCLCTQLCILTTRSFSRRGGAASCARLLFELGALITIGGAFECAA